MDSNQTYLGGEMTTVGDKVGMRALESMVVQNVSNMTTMPSVTEALNTVKCAADIPTAAVMMKHLSLLGILVLVVCSVVTLVTIGVLVEECIFLSKFYKNPRRRAETITVLSVIPVFSFTSLLALWVPRSSTLTDLVAAAYFGYCLYCFVHLTADYHGGPKKMVQKLTGREMRLRTGPCCCCCICLPKLTFDRKKLRNIRLLVLQTAVLKPILMLVAAVLWTDGLYHPGSVNPYSVSLYINILNIMSTMFAMYGLNQLLGVCGANLKDFSIRAKFFTLQLVLIVTSVLALLCSLLVKFGAIPCIHPFASVERADRLCHILIIVVMIPFSVLGRRFYLREAEYKPCLDKAAEINGQPDSDRLAVGIHESIQFIDDDTEGGTLA